MSDAFPKYENHFAHKLTRLTLKMCLASRIGPEAVLLIIQIAHTQDARRYRGPASFWNEHLADVCGLKNVKALDRVRAKAIESGFLKYRAGTKSRAGEYWTVIPDDLFGITDAPIDQSESDTFLVENDQESGKNPGGKREESGKNPGRIRQASGQHSNPIPFPPTDPSPTKRIPPESCTEPPKAASEPKNENDPGVLVFPTVGKGAKEWVLRSSKVAEYVESFPGIDVMAECRKALQWARDNPTKRKTPAGMLKFLGGWLSREQNGHPRAGPARYAPDPVGSAQRALEIVQAERNRNDSTQ